MHPGVTDCRRDPLNLTERSWEGRPKRVRAPYVKTEQAERDPEYHETRGTLWESGGTTPKAKYYLVTDSA